MPPNSVLYLVENVPCFIQILQSKFTAPILVVGKDFREVTSHDLPFGKPDLVLWMWSGLADFSNDEQKSVLLVLKELMASNGLAIIDLPSLQSKINATSIPDSSSEGTVGTIQIDGLQTVFNGFIPSQERIQELGKEIGLILEKTEEYNTPVANRKRVQYFFKKSL